MNSSFNVQLLWLTIGVCTSAAAQTVDPQTMKNQLLELRAKELIESYSGDKDAEIAVKTLNEALKGSDALKTTVVRPCPPVPAPSPSGQVVPKVAEVGEWRRVVGPEAKRIALEIPPEKFSSRQRSLLVDRVAIEFAEPGNPTKFSTVLAPGCPRTSPTPSGASGSK